MTRLSLTRVARSIGQAAVVAVMVWGRPSAADAPRKPIEVEVQPGAVSCAPGDASFDRGFRAALQLSQLATVDTARKHGVIPNAFCLASDRPNVLPLRVRVRGLKQLPEGGYYELFLTRNGKAVASCGTAVSASTPREKK